MNEPCEGTWRSSQISSASSETNYLQAFPGQSTPPPGELLSQVSIWCSGCACLSLPSLDLPCRLLLCLCVCLEARRQVLHLWAGIHFLLSLSWARLTWLHSGRWMCPPFANGSWFNTTLKRQVGKELVICWGQGSFCYSILTICICKTKDLRAPVPSNHHCSKKKKTLSENGSALFSATLVTVMGLRIHQGQLKNSISNFV